MTQITFLLILNIIIGVKTSNITKKHTNNVNGQTTSDRAKTARLFSSQVSPRGGASCIVQRAYSARVNDPVCH